MGHLSPTPGLLLISLLLLPGTGFAHGGQADENVTYGYAQVLRASPVYETTRSKVPEQRCDGPAAGGNRCRIVQVDREERRLAGYDVEYQYKGEKYMSRLDSDPGNRVRIRISVVPEQAPVGYR